MKITRVHHVCIQTDDYDASLWFYTELLGLELVKESRQFHDRDFNTWLRCDGMLIELQTPKADTRLNPWSKLNAGPVHLAVLVDDVESAYQELRRRGWTRFKKKGAEEVYEAGGSTIFKVLAPEGTEIEFRSNPGI